MIKELREGELNKDAKHLAKDVVNEILAPLQTGQKLTKKQQIHDLATKKSLERQIDMLKKLGK